MECILQVLQKGCIRGCLYTFRLSTNDILSSKLFSTFGNHTIFISNACATGRGAVLSDHVKCNTLAASFALSYCNFYLPSRSLEVWSYLIDNFYILCLRIFVSSNTKSTNILFLWGSLKFHANFGSAAEVMSTICTQIRFDEMSTLHAVKVTPMPLPLGLWTFFTIFLGFWQTYYAACIGFLNVLAYTETYCQFLI